jgi:hypothetical protein
MGRVEQMREVNRQREVLSRILALLLLMASLADRAAGLPFRRRSAVLQILGRGEAEARALVLAMAAGAPACDDDAAPEAAAGDVARAVADGDAARMAAGFRVLALALGVLLARAAQSPIFSASMKAACGMPALPNWRMRFLPSFRFSGSLRVTSPP